MGKKIDMADHMGRFIVAAMENPEGYKPGLYFYAMHMATGRKVSRYLRRHGQVARKVEKYERLWAEGDRYWPAVGRCDELRDSRDAVPSYKELLQNWLHLGCSQ
jgi:hypothetical protein